MDGCENTKEKGEIILNTYSDVLCTKTCKKFGIVKGNRYPLLQIKEKVIVILQDAVGKEIPVEYFL